MIEAGDLLGRRIGMLARLAETVAAEQKDFGVFHQPVGDAVGKLEEAGLGRGN